MKKIYFKQRDISAHWATFERFLFKNKHTGWIHWIDHQQFYLTYNPYSEHPRSESIYLVPEDITDIPRNGLISVHTCKTVKLPSKTPVQKNGTVFTYTKVFEIVDKWEPFHIKDLPLPAGFQRAESIHSLLKIEGESVANTMADMFLNKVTCDWRGEEKKSFPLAVALNLLSCPKGDYGIGGIGAQTLSTTHQQSLKQLNTTMKQNLMGDFLRQNKSFIYCGLTKKNDEKRANNIITKQLSNELSYNYLMELTPELQKMMMPRQIPIVIPDATYSPSSSQTDPDIIDYHLSALLIDPIVPDRIEKRLSRVLTKHTKSLMRKTTLQDSLDPTGLLRLGKSYCRLFFLHELKESDFDSLVKHLLPAFKEYFDLAEDMRELETTYHTPLTRDIGLTERYLNVTSENVLGALKDYQRIYKTDIIKRSLVYNEVDLSKIDVDGAIDQLSRFGYIMLRKNGEEITLLI